MNQTHQNDVGSWSLNDDSIVKDQHDGYKFHEPPKANWKISLGEIPDAYATYICIYVKKPPNRFQRWMIKKVLGIHWTPV
jgi:hypothetical protein